MPLGSKPPFTLQTAQQTVKTLQALWNTREPRKILSAYAPNCVWRPKWRDERSALYSRADEQSTFLSGFFAYKQEYLVCMKLHDFNSRLLGVKMLAEYHGYRKHLEDPIFRQKQFDYPGKEGKRWKRQAGLQYILFNEHGRIHEVLHHTYATEIKKEDRLLRGFREADEISYPRIAIHHEMVEEDGRLWSLRCAPYHV